MLYFVLRFLIEREIIKFKFFFVACFICSLFVSFDLIFQYFVGKNFFGYVSDDPRRLGGPFGNEYIAGSYLQRFSIFSFFLFVCFIKVKKQKNIFLIFIILTLILIFGMLVSGNRIPLIMFLVLFFLSFILLKKMRIFILIFAASSSLVFLLLINTNLNVKQHFGHFNNQLKLFSNFVATILIEEKSSEITEKDYVIKLDNKLVQIPNVWLKEFYYGYKTWKLNTLFGGGIKSFKINCPKTKVLNCPMHPHNYYLEILSDLGLIGFLIIGILIISILYAAFSTKIIFKYNLIIPFVSLLFVEFFPIKTTGSFFTTGNATFNFLIIAIVISIINSKKNKLI